MRAAENGHASIVTQLLQAGADVNAKTSEGATALSLAIAKNHVDIAAMLRLAGAKEPAVEP